MDKTEVLSAIKVNLFNFKTYKFLFLGWWWGKKFKKSPENKKISNPVNFEKNSVFYENVLEYLLGNIILIQA